MRMTQRTADALIVEEGTGTNLMIGFVAVALGAAGISIGWMKSPIGFLIIAPILALFGLKVLLFNRTKDGERIRWADSYDGSKENTLDCYNAAREWLNIEPNSPATR